LVYANTLPKPKGKFYTTGTWSELADWKEELTPHYDTALRMLGAAKNPKLFDSDVAFQKLAQEIGNKHFEPTDVAVFFGEPDKKYEDPYFEGKGPERVVCNCCGKCMTGSTNKTKNKLDKNYLHQGQK